MTRIEFLRTLVFGGIAGLIPNEVVQGRVQLEHPSEPTPSIEFIRKYPLTTEQAFHIKKRHESWARK